MTKRILYGVSTGDGYNGVSHVFANYYVRTADPWLLARAATYDMYEPREWSYLDENLQVDGEEAYTISAYLYEEPDFQPPTMPCEACEGEGYYVNEPEDCIDYEEYECEECGGTGQIPDDTYESGPCQFVLEVFPANEGETRKRPIYNSIKAALTEEAIERAKDLD